MQKLKGESGEMGWADNTGLDDKCRVFTKNGKSVDCPCRCVSFGKGLAYEYAPECKVHGMDDAGIITPGPFARPQWTKEPPTVPGWYWFRDNSGTDIIRFDGVAFWNDEGAICKSYEFSDGEWCGPLLPPE